MLCLFWSIRSRLEVDMTKKFGSGSFIVKNVTYFAQIRKWEHTTAAADRLHSSGGCMACLQGLACKPTGTRAEPVLLTQHPAVHGTLVRLQQAASVLLMTEHMHAFEVMGREAAAQMSFAAHAHAHTLKAPAMICSSSSRYIATCTAEGGASCTVPAAQFH